MIEQLKQNFIKVFDSEPEGVYFAPGRVNLIGEHTDYNGGHVFPCAISIGTYGVASRRKDKKIRLYSQNFPDIGIIEVDLDDLAYRKEDEWTNYPKGMIHFLQEAGYEINEGMDLYYYGNIPNGAGLSSSASIELLTGVILQDLFHLDLDRVELVKIGQKVENEYIGVNSGIMDQFAVGMGKKDYAILLDCQTLDYEWVPATLEDYVIVIMNTNKRRELADSKYNERRGECEEALRRLQKVMEIHSLGDLNEESFEANRKQIGDEVLERRACHALTENERTLKAKEALTNGDLALFGQLLNQSHQSLKEDYEVTGIELDTLVTAAQEQPGVLGARMTGAGFGGCAIALVKEEQLADFQEKVNQRYQEKIGYAADFYLAHIHDGAQKIMEE